MITRSSAKAKTFRGRLLRPHNISLFDRRRLPPAPCSNSPTRPVEGMFCPELSASPSSCPREPPYEGLASVPYLPLHRDAMKWADAIQHGTTRTAFLDVLTIGRRFEKMRAFAGGSSRLRVSGWKRVVKQFKKFGAVPMALRTAQPHRRVLEQIDKPRCDVALPSSTRAARERSSKGRIRRIPSTTRAKNLQAARRQSVVLARSASEPGERLQDQGRQSNGRPSGSPRGLMIER